MKGKRSPTLVGQTFGKWTVLERIGYIDKATRYRCRCECGRVGIIPRSNLILGRSQSCGNHRQYTNRTHGMSDTPVYRSWMNKRVAGGVAGRWTKFESYVEDTLKHPNLRAVRQDLSKPFSPENCRWMSPSDAIRHINSIHDEFASLRGKVSRQRIYQLRRRKEGKCIRCGKRSNSGKVLCQRCRAKTNGNKTLSRE